MSGTVTKSIVGGGLDDKLIGPARMEFRLESNYQSKQLVISARGGGDIGCCSSVVAEQGSGTSAVAAGNDPYQVANWERGSASPDDI